MTTRTVNTYTAQIYMGGDIDTARAVLRSYVNVIGLCVTLEAVEYIYKGGLEAGIRVGLINYPRFPKSPLDLRSQALDLARWLREQLCQHSFSVVMPDETVWDSLRPADGSAA